MKLFHYSKLDSSQLEANKLAILQPKLNNFVVLTDQQTEGFGKRGAKWISPIGNIYCSYTFRLNKICQNNNRQNKKHLTKSPAHSNNFLDDNIYYNLDIAEHPISIQPLDMHFAIAIAVFNAIKKVILDEFISKLFIKWPNDIFLDGKKICGIITEIRDSVIIIGVGINSMVVPYGIKDATCLNAYLKNNKLPINNIGFVKDIYSEFCETIKTYENNQLAIYQHISDNLAFKNKKREVVSNKKKFLATILDINHDYSLEVLNHSTKEIEKLDSATIQI